MKADLLWKNGMQFECDNRGMKSTIDAVAEHGGTNAGPTPKELLLNAMMGCTAMDVVSMLKKMRQEITEFKMEIDAEKTTEHPTYFKTAYLKFILKGEILPEKLIKSVDSSMTKYCGVNFMMSKSCDISFKVFLNSIEIHHGKAIF